MRPRTTAHQLTLIVAGVFALDQLTKHLAVTFLGPGHSMALWGEGVRLTVVENTGLAFGLQIPYPVLVNTLSIFAVAILIYYLVTLGRQPVLRLAFAFILGGALGNLSDRLLQGRVIDFLDIDVIDLPVPILRGGSLTFDGGSADRWLVFNLADVAVSIGIGMLLLALLLDRFPRSALTRIGDENA